MIVFLSKKSIPQGYSKTFPILLRYISLLASFGETNIRIDNINEKNTFLVNMK